MPDLRSFTDLLRCAAVVALLVDVAACGGTDGGSDSGAKDARDSAAAVDAQIGGKDAATDRATDLVADAVVAEAAPETTPETSNDPSDADHDGSAPATDAGATDGDAAPDAPAVDSAPGQDRPDEGILDAAGDGGDPDVAPDSGAPGLDTAAASDASDDLSPPVDAASDAPPETTPVIPDAAAEQTPGEAGTDGGSSCPVAQGWQILGAGQIGVESYGTSLPSLTLIDGIQPVVSWQEGTQVYSRAWRVTGCAGEWVPLSNSNEGHGAVLASAKGQLYRASAAPTGRLAVDRWDGSTYVPLGAPLGATTQRAYSPAMVTNSAGYPVVAWIADPSTTRSQAHAARWDGANWVDLTESGGVLQSFVYGGTGRPLSLTLASGDIPVAAWGTYFNATTVARFTGGTSWSSVGTPPPSTFGGGEDTGPIVRANSAGQMYLASVDHTPTGGYHITVAHLVGSSWQLLTGATEVGNGGGDFDLNFDATGAVILVNYDYVAAEKSRRWIFHRWNGSDWQVSPQPLPSAAPARSSSNPSCVLAATAACCWRGAKARTKIAAPSPLAISPEGVGGQLTSFVRRINCQAARFTLQTLEAVLARVTVEDCLENVNNRFALVILAAERARQLANGAKALIRCHNKPAVTSLREIAKARVKFNESVDTTVNQYLAEVKNRGLRPDKHVR